MTIPSLAYAPSSQNQRVKGFEIPGDETPRIYTTADSLKLSEMDQLIQAAYRQIFNEQQMIASNRQIALESQLKGGFITVKQFIYGLAISDVFRWRNYDVNNNYRFVQLCIQRILGRDVYSDREKLAWSIVLATKGLRGFMSELLDSEEYQTTFGDYTVPYQRRRILPQRTQGELPFARMPRYGADYRDKLPKQIPPIPTGLFTQDEEFDLQTFMQRANWNRVSTVFLLTSLLLVFLLLFSEANRIFLG
jgi:phycobilisome rod-core linker protein